MTILQNQYETIKLVEKDSWLTIWLDRPKAKNALSEKMTVELMEILNNVASNKAFRGLALRGTGECFCSGADLKEFQTNFVLNNATREQIIELSTRMAELFKRIYTMPLPVIALVEGAAFAGGFGIVCCSDVVLGTQNTKFSISETKIGLTPAQIAPYLVNRIGLRNAKKIILLGTVLNGTQAYDFGVIDQLAKDKLDLEAQFTALTKNIGACAPKATAITKDILINHGQQEPCQMTNFLANKFADCLTGEEAKEGLKAFSEKRNPKWAEI